MNFTNPHEPTGASPPVFHTPISRASTPVGTTLVAKSILKAAVVDADDTSISMTTSSTPTDRVSSSATAAVTTETIDATDASAAADVTVARRIDRGSTFVEILVAIVLMGFAVSAVIAGLYTTIVASSTSDAQAKVEAVLTSASDRLAVAPYIPCPGPTYGDYAHLVAAAAAAVDWDPSQVTIQDIQFWDSTYGAALNANGDPIAADGAWRPTNSLSGTVECNPDINLTTARTLQKLIIRVSSPDGGVVRTLEVVKSPIVADSGSSAP